MINFLFLPFETVLPHKDDQKFMMPKYGVFFLLSFLRICLYSEHKYTHFLCVLLGTFKRILKILKESIWEDTSLFLSDLSKYGKIHYFFCYLKQS